MASERKEESCSGCRFFKEEWPGQIPGLCRRHPPNIDNEFARTMRHDWCGEFAPPHQEGEETK